MSVFSGIGVVGAGGEGRAVAAYLASRDLPVHLHTRDPRAVAGIANRREIDAEGALNGRFPIRSVSDDPAELAGRAVILIATITTAYPEVAARIAPYLSPGQVVVLFSSKLCGSVEFAHALAVAGAPGVDVVETDALFAARPDGTGGVRVLGVKGWNLLSGSCPVAVTRHAGQLCEWFPMLEVAGNPVERGLHDFGAVAHVPIALANLGAIDRAEDLLFYLEGLSPRTVALLERTEAEFAAVAEAYGARLLPMTEVLDRYYGCTRTCLLDAIRTVEPYKAIAAPASLDHRFLTEDIRSTLVPLQALARCAGVATPMVDAAITIMSVLGGEDFRRTGRTLRRLDWDGLSHDRILRRLAAA
ncbi:NAD/NADP-dependent octopine/nopaline dehydrogenase family protein [Amycolatopsis sp. H20-H5]|uniref:NAD/NADP-dependent octopine/nopaline dehydrogenase family protein n=1 Tax=Amycolatopsis sp. H20-H5 TaxID=3046309 RepID=UPI002DBC902B|nr:NAD/NADP octopine/nopaline dehydrogenase family protein [Amycolatopsis sp. H20-H5]MEC3973968.1 NAD/NADP octopine/nopaline dehydrogenase family protein [Amycolatopsis sp. H20-H5]